MVADNAPGYGGRTPADPAPWPLGPLGIPAPAGSPRVAVLGLARSGIGAARLLLDRRCRVDLLDLRLAQDREEDVRGLSERGARVRIGSHDPQWLEDYDLVVKSPGVPGATPFVVEARRRGIAVVAELELAWLAVRGPVFAITGTNGKSTTTAWAGDMLRESGIVSRVAGNIGLALSEAVLDAPDAAFVVEVSSFQLEDARTFRPRAAALLNVTPDHLDRHGDLEAYIEAKLSIFDRQESADLSIAGADEDLARTIRGRGRARRARFAANEHAEEGAFLREDRLWLRSSGRETPLLERGRLSLPGPHNLENAMAAAVGAAELGASTEAIARSLREFPGLPHRLETVGEVRGVRFVNDSKATNGDSLAVALRSFTDPVVLIAGGRDKGQDFRPLRDLVARSVSLLVLIGEATEKLEAQWAGVPSVRARSLEEAVRLAADRAASGGIALLSPACASFDMFRNYEDRGDQFRELVRRISRQRPNAESG